MNREEVLALLVERLGDADVVERTARRHPDVDPAAELVPLAIGMAALEGGTLQRVQSSISNLTGQCRDAMRLRLQGKSFEEISESLETDAVGVYARCRKRLFPLTTPLYEYAAGRLSSEDRIALFERALTERSLFDSLRDEQTLMTLSEDPAASARLLEAVEDVRFTIGRGLREWFDRPKAKVLLIAALVALGAIVLRDCGGFR